MANLVVHFELHASDPQQLIDYYAELLGWTFQSYGGGDSRTGSSTRAKARSATLRPRRALAATVV